RQDVDRDLGPGARHLDVVEPEDDRAVGIADLAAGGAKSDRFVRRPPRGRERTLNPHQPHSSTASHCGWTADGFSTRCSRSRAVPGATERIRNPEVAPWSCGSRGISVVALHLIPLNLTTPIVPATATTIVSTRTVFSLRARRNP